MEINSIAHLATSLAQQRSAQDVSVAVLKKTMQVQQDTASALLATLPPVEAVSLPPHLGQTINTT
ncbi:MAG TPA: YjfB family protein, partial [Burkholderiaceae bacterium]|nr:YjfB family protein [Burkholderiaceae bacterium]